ncbi:hypothetical protein [Jannaschia marina]|uniref:hypothetical protein n=1 Tax=Jannaschia marina TaxID=2741674 RepID=UPI0015CBDF10|nr:hypothetical protein [Jannaschia marina]
MTADNILRIERIHFDYLRACVEGTAICRYPSGRIVRRHLSVAADLHWSHDAAEAALQREAIAVL